MNAAVGGLLDHQYDVAVTGGIDRNMGVDGFVKFCKIGALSATGTRPFDAGADGFVMGEGAAVFVLKRLADAERDGDRIYAVLLGLGGSSDGKGKGITAPNPVGQRLAVERAWRRPGLDPAAAGLMRGARHVHPRRGPGRGRGAAKRVRAGRGGPGLHPARARSSPTSATSRPRRAPPGCSRPPWRCTRRCCRRACNFRDPEPQHRLGALPVRGQHRAARLARPARPAPAPAGVSAFGFGGTNFHAVLEEYVPGRHRTDERRSYAGVGRPAGEHRSRPAPRPRCGRHRGRRPGRARWRAAARRRCAAPSSSALPATADLAAPAAPTSCESAAAVAAKPPAGAGSRRPGARPSGSRSTTATPPSWPTRPAGR